MTQRTISMSRDLAERELDRLAEARPDYVYEKEPGTFKSSCVYFDDERKPSCIVGHVLSRLGFEPGDDFMRAANAEDVEGLVAGGWLDVDEATTWLLQEAQRLQDDGQTWATAVAHAKAVAERETEHH